MDADTRARSGTETCCATDLALELARLRELEAAAREFCERCERGEIRSLHSYRRFRTVLARRPRDGRCESSPAPG